MPITLIQISSRMRVVTGARSPDLKAPRLSRAPARSARHWAHPARCDCGGERIGHGLDLLAQGMIAHARAGFSHDDRGPFAGCRRQHVKQGLGSGIRHVLCVFCKCTTGSQRSAAPPQAPLEAAGTNRESVEFCRILLNCVPRVIGLNARTSGKSTAFPTRPTSTSMIPTTSPTLRSESGVARTGPAPCK